jgi:hypothetical protein
MDGAVIEGITLAQRAALKALAPALDDTTYLAGGVAIAVRLHHRTSLGLDLFVRHDFDPERLAEQLTPTVVDLRIVGRGPGTLHAEVFDVPVSVLSLRAPLLRPAAALADVPVPLASLEDLACMKIAAIAGRGAAKDFWDLDELLGAGVAGGSLSALLGLFRTKYASEDIGHVVRALAYFGDADAAPLPRGLTSDRWAAIRHAQRHRVRAL